MPYHIVKTNFAVKDFPCNFVDKNSYLLFHCHKTISSHLCKKTSYNIRKYQYFNGFDIRYYHDYIK